MKGGNYSFDIERYHVAADPDGDRLELDGWILSDSPLATARLVPAGTAPIAVALHAQADDNDRRLLLHLRAGLDGLDGLDTATLQDASLEIDAANGDRLAFGIGHLFRPAGWMPAIVAFATGPGDPSATLDAEVPDAFALAHALRTGFDAIDRDADLFLHRGATGWIATSHRYGIRFNAPLDGALPKADARHLAAAAARAAVAGLLDKLDRSVPLLVYRRADGDTDDGAAALFAALRARNPYAALLWIDPHRDGGPVARFRPGADEPVQPGFLVVAGAGDRDAMLLAARDLLLSGR